MNIFRRDFIKASAGALVLPGIPVAAFAADSSAPPRAEAKRNFLVTTFGAAGNGRTVDTPAINRAIEAAADSGGGTVVFPAGTYLSYSIHLKSHVTLYLDPGACILSASVPLEGIRHGGYDAAEPNAPWDKYQDFGHSHWHNSLIWGENLEDVAICGPGLIWGRHLSRSNKGRSVHDRGLPLAELPGVANKAIALKNCHNVLLRDFSILEGGHMGILTTGVDNLTIDNLKIDTNRDAMNIDCCRNVRIINTSVNSPWDDGICLKSTYALGEKRVTENVTVSNCYVTGVYEVGAMLDGSYRKMKPDGVNGVPTGRIKLGTGSVGGFKNIAIANCVFDTCRGLALECVDGGDLEDVTITGITMRNITTTPLFLRLGSRLRAPKGAMTGVLRRIILSDIVSSNAQSTFAAMIMGVPGHPVEDIKISNVYLENLGGGTGQMAKIEPPERPAVYPEPKNFGPMPASGFFLRHVKNIELSSVEIATLRPDFRPAMWLDDVNESEFYHLKVPRDSPAFSLRNCRDFTVSASRRIANTSLANVTSRLI